MYKIYLDECGFTGEDLFNVDQPIFTLASIDLTEEICNELKSKHFNKVKAVELKHSSLAKRDNSQKMIIELIKDLSVNYPNSIKFSVVHKRYALVSKIVDILVEEVCYENGIDLYKRGANIALSNMLFYLMRSLASEDFFNNTLFNFQEMMRNRTKESYNSFFMPIFNNNFPKELDNSLSLIKDYHMLFGFSELKKISEDILDITLSQTLLLMHEWKIKIPESETIILIHDRSSNMSKNKIFWDKLVSPNSEPKIVGYDIRKMSYPIRINKTNFENSKEFVGLQIVDILAGAISRYFKWIINGKVENDTYGKILDIIMPSFFDFFDGHMLWPRPCVSPQELGTIGTNADDPIEYIVNIQNELSKT